MRVNTTAELGKFKTLIQTALYKSDDIRDLILGDTSGMKPSDVRKEFKKHVDSHLFVDEILTETSTYIFYDVRIPYLHTQTKKCEIIMYMICHRSIIDDYHKEGYYGDRVDILTQMVEKAIINDKDIANSFGIGSLTLDSVDFYNSRRFYGRLLTFSVPDFRMKRS